VKDRASSAVRRAFSVAAEGKGKSIALDAYPTTEPATAFSKLSRALAEDGDLNPTWVTLDLIGAAAPETVLRALCEAWGFDAPRPIAPTLERSLAAVSTHVEQLELGLASVREALDRIEVAALRERKGPVRVEPARRRTKGAA
jgi:hypothetical protein